MSSRGRRASGSSSERRRSLVCGASVTSTAGGAGWAGIDSKYLRASAPHAGRCHVAGDGQDRVVRRVVGLEERGHVLRRGRVQILHRADHRMLVGRIVERELVHRIVGSAVGLIVASLPPFFLHRLALVVEILLHDRERSHAVGLEKEPRLELVGRHRLEIERALLVRRAVHRAAVAEDRVEVLAGADVFGPLEHHVLEQVREAGPALPLVARSDVVDHGDGEHRRDVILGDDEPQAVRQPGLGEHDLRRRDRRRRRSHGQRDQDRRGHEPGGASADHGSLLRRASYARFDF